MCSALFQSGVNTVHTLFYSRCEERCASYGVLSLYIVRFYNCEMASTKASKGCSSNVDVRQPAGANES